MIRKVIKDYIIRCGSPQELRKICKTFDDSDVFAIQEVHGETWISLNQEKVFTEDLKRLKNIVGEKVYSEILDFLEMD